MLMRIVYRDAAGVVSLREVDVLAQTDSHLEGLCSTARAWRSFRRDRILEVLPAEEAAVAAERLAFWQAQPRPAPTGRAQGRVKVALEVCFTGFAAADKARLTGVAQAAGMVVRSGVTAQLDFLCGGRNAGPAKLDRAEEQGVLIVDEAEFLDLLETGALPVPGTESVGTCQ